MPKNKRYYIKTTLDMQMLVAIPSLLGIVPRGVFFLSVDQAGRWQISISRCPYVRITGNGDVAPPVWRMEDAASHGHGHVACRHRALRLPLVHTRRCV